MKRVIYLPVILLFLLMMACTTNVATVSEQDVEALRVDYNKGKLETVEEMIAVYNDPLQPTATRIAALRALAATQHPDAQQAMYNLLVQGVGLNYELMTATANALLDNRSQENINALVDGIVSAQEKYIRFRTELMQQLETTDITVQAEKLLRLYEAEKENYAQMQESLTRVLGSAQDEKVIPILINIAKDKTVNLGVRSTAVEILGKRKHPLVTETFIEMLGDPDSQEQIRDFALQAIGDVKEAEVILALLETFNAGKAGYFHLTEVLAKALGEFSDPSVVPALIEIAQNTEFPLKTRQDAITALTNFNDPEIFLQLLPIMEEPANYILFDEMTSMASSLGDPKLFDQLRQKALEAQQKAMVTP